MRIRSLFQKIRSISGQAGKEREPIPPCVLSSPVRFPYGPFKLKAQLAADIPYEIQATTNLKDWILIAMDTASHKEVDYVDSSASNFSQRFYRLNAGGSFSANVIGYISVTLPPGFSMIANPLQGANNSVADLFQDMPDGASFSKYNTQLSKLTENKIKNGKWMNPVDKLLPGEGALFFNPTSDYKTLNFVGEVKQGSFSTPIPSGFSIRSSFVPLPGRLDVDLGFPVSEGDVIHLFDRDSQKYALYPYDATGWTTKPPIISVGESFWIAKKTPKNWAQRFLNT